MRRKTRISTARVLYRLTLAFFIVLICVVLLAALFDIGQQLITQERSTTRATDIIISTGTYVLIALVAIVILLSRLLTVKQLMQSVPKSYMPIKKEDVPKAVHTLITAEYARCALISHISQPTNRTLEGWGEPGSKYENVRFRTAILETVKYIDKLYTEEFSEGSAIYVDTSISPYHSPLKPLYGPCFDAPAPLLPAALRIVFDKYDEVLEKAKYAAEEPTAEDLEAALKTMLIIVSKVKVALASRQKPADTTSLNSIVSIESEAVSN